MPSPYRAENTILLGNKNQTVNAVEWNIRCLSSDPYKTHTLCGQNVELLKVKHKVTTALCGIPQVASYFSDGRFATHFCDLWRQSQSLPYSSPDMCSHLTWPCHGKTSPRPRHSLQKSPYFTYVISHVRVRFIARDSPKRRPLHSV